MLESFSCCVYKNQGRNDFGSGNDKRSISQINISLGGRLHRIGPKTWLDHKESKYNRKAQPASPG